MKLVSQVLLKVKRVLAKSPAHKDAAYYRRLEQELAHYADDVNVHDLPAIFHYWSNRYIRPWLEAVGATHPEGFFSRYLAEAAQGSDNQTARFISIGSGNCDAEVAVAQDLLVRGVSKFTIECLDINPKMLERGRRLAKEKNLDDKLLFLQADFNEWIPDKKYDGVIANQCLHHVQNLEGLFDSIASALKSHGLFITSDMIGRNGHQRWPEALKYVEEIWQTLPEKYRYNHPWKRLDLDFVNHDCSTEGFEGVRAQDIMSELLKRFNFQVFIAFGNVVDVFVDRAYGHNYDPDSEWDRAIIDKAHAIDEAGFRDGTLTPTQMMAVMTLPEVSCTKPYYARGLTPECAVRNPSMGE